MADHAAHAAGPAGAPISTLGGTLGDPRFFHRAGPFSLARVAEQAGAKLPDGADGAAMLTGVAPVQSAGRVTSLSCITANISTPWP